MKVVIPVAGIGSRLNPHTYSTPKPLMEVAGKTIIARVLEDVKKLNPEEIIFVVNYKKELIEDYIKENFPSLKCSFVEQTTRDGDGSAVRCALKKFDFDDEVFVIFGADTLLDFDIKKSIVRNRLCDVLVFTCEVEDPKHYGVVVCDKNNRITEIEEKPQNPRSNQAIVGAYFFKSSDVLKKNLEYFYNNKISVKGEYKLMQAISKYIQAPDSMVKACKVDKWFDCGRPEILLNSNKYYLSQTSKLSKPVAQGNALLIPPCYIHKNAKLENCVVGPYVSVGDGAVLENVCIQNSIVGSKSQISNIILKNSLIGKEVILRHRLKQINIGDKSQIFFE